MRNTIGSYSALSELHANFVFLPRGDAPRSAQRLPLAIIFRAVGAPQIELRPLVQSRVRLSDDLSSLRRHKMFIDAEQHDIVFAS